MARIAFYCNDTRPNIDTFEYYKQDIDAMRQLGHDVVICTRYRELPRDFDLVYIWWWTYALFPVLLSRWRGKPSSVTGIFNFRFPSAFPERDYFKRPWWQRQMIGWATKLATQNLFINDEEMRTCTPYFGLSNARHMTLALGEEYLQGPGADRQVALFNLAWSGRGNLERKGIPDLLKAVAILKDQGFTVKLTLAGPEGDGMPYLRELIARYGIGSQVEHLGRLDKAHKINLLRRYEIYVQPSYYEGFGLATAEAMGCGAAIITCDAGAVRSVVGDCARYVPSGAPDQLAAAIRSVVENSVLRRDLQDRALRRARDHFRFGVKVEQMREVLAAMGVR